MFSGQKHAALKKLLKGTFFGPKFFLGQENVATMTDDELSTIRATRIGFVFQSYNLIPQLTVVENIEVPLYYQGRLDSSARQRCHQLADMVGLGDRLNHRPTQLSGGQQQRVAIARSMVNDPYFILADEATGNLDTATTEEILQIFGKLNDEGRTIIMVTHEDEVSQHAKRVIRLRDGLIQSDAPIENRVVTRHADDRVAFDGNSIEEGVSSESVPED